MFTTEEVLEEVRKIQYFYILKKEIRYGESRTDVGESVAEHIYGMHVLAAYFLKLEDPDGTWNTTEIYQMITWHDMDEIETGDIIGYKKTNKDRKRGITAIEEVIKKSPDILREHIERVSSQYEKQDTVEARFVKALDKIEPLFQIYNENGKRILLRNKTTLTDSRKIKDVYVESFPHMKHFNNVLNNAMDTEGFFTKLA